MKLKNLLLTATLIIAAIAMQSCGGNSPVGKYVACINSLTEKMEKAETIDDIKKLEKESNPSIEEFRDSDYELTDADKKDIVRAMSDFVVVSIEKGFKLSGIDVTLDNERKEAIKAEIEANIDKATTLGDVASAGSKL